MCDRPLALALPLLMALPLPRPLAAMSLALRLDVLLVSGARDAGKGSPAITSSNMSSLTVMGILDTAFLCSMAIQPMTLARASSFVPQSPPHFRHRDPGCWAPGYQPKGQAGLHKREAQPPHTHSSKQTHAQEHTHTPEQTHTHTHTYKPLGTLMNASTHLQCHWPRDTCAHTHPH